MRRVEISVGLLATVALVVVLSYVVATEGSRMARASRSWEARQIEAGAEMFSTHCASCHGVNAVGGTGPPLDEGSGLHGGDSGVGIAWRLEELGWNRTELFGYVYETTASGRSVSTRPERYPGDRVSAAEPPSEETPGGAARAPALMAMPSHADEYGGPLTSDQIDALARYIVAFEDALPRGE